MTESELIPLMGLTRVFAGLAAADVVNVHDGDTFSANIPGWPDVVGKGILVRLYGVDAPELHDRRPELAELALRAREALRQLLDRGGVMLTTLRRDKYFRLLAGVAVRGIADVAEAMIRDGLARPYFGVGVKPW